MEKGTSRQRKRRNVNQGGIEEEGMLEGKQTKIETGGGEDEGVKGM